MAVLAFKNLTLGYGRHPAVHHLNCEIAPGSLNAILGPNGSGKTTLFKGVMGQLKPMEGHIRLDGVMRHEIAHLPQQSSIDHSFPATVFEFVALGLWNQSGHFSGISSAQREKVARALADVGLSGFSEHTLDMLSGGQLQRALFSRVLLQDAKLILLDEPFTAIDTRTTNDLIKIVHQWHEEKRTVLAILHDQELIRQHFPNCLLLARELVAWGKTNDVLQPANLHRARHMNEAWDENAPWCEVPETS